MSRAQTSPILRRCRPDAGGPATEVARFAGWTVDFRSFQLFAPDGTEVEVTASEVRLLRSFLTMPRRVLTREALMDAEATRQDWRLNAEQWREVLGMDIELNAQGLDYWLGQHSPT